MLTPLDPRYQTLLSGENQPFMHQAVVAAGHYLECNNLLGWQASGKDAAQAVIDDEALWLLFAKVAKLEDLAQMYQNKIAAGFFYGGKVIQIGDEDTRNINAQTTKATICMDGKAPWNPDFAWITLDNSMLALPTPQDMVDMALAAGAYVEGLIFANRTLKNAISGAASKAALDLIDLGGWPSSP